MAVKILRKLQTSEYQQPFERKIQLWNNILAKNRKQSYILFLKYAAIFLLMVGISTILVFISHKSNSKLFSTHIVENQNNTMLFWADGGKTILTGKQSKIQCAPPTIDIFLNDTTFIQSIVAKEGINQLITPFGKRSKILLSDGTKVWLNSGTSLSFSSSFKEKIREVFLEGEAYFEVAKDTQKPFLIYTDRFRVKVYGTRFDIITRKEDNSFNTVLLEGKISLKPNYKFSSEELFLVPNQKASYISEQKNLQITEVSNSEDYIDWINGYIVFNNDDLSSVLKRISSYYNIIIEEDLQKNSGKIFGKLDLKDDPKEVLDCLATISGTKYFKYGNKYVFLSK